jgi:chaperone modulatory protein CbpM
MNPHPPDNADLGAEELASLCGMSVVEIGELLEYGVLEPSSTHADDPRYGVDCVATLREASRLRLIFDLDVFTVSLLLGYLQRIEALERELKSLHARVPHTAIDRDGPATWREPHA